MWSSEKKGNWMRYIRFHLAQLNFTGETIFLCFSFTSSFLSEIRLFSWPYLVKQFHLVHQTNKITILPLLFFSMRPFFNARAPALLLYVTILVLALASRALATAPARTLMPLTAHASVAVLAHAMRLRGTPVVAPTLPAMAARTLSSSRLPR